MNFLKSLLGAAGRSGELFNQANDHWKRARDCASEGNHDLVIEELINTVNLTQQSIAASGKNGDAYVLLSNALLRLSDFAEDEESSDELLRLAAAAIFEWNGLPYRGYPITRNMKAAGLLNVQLWDALLRRGIVTHYSDSELTLFAQRLGSWIIHPESLGDVMTLTRPEASTEGEDDRLAPGKGGHLFGFPGWVAVGVVKTLGGQEMTVEQYMPQHVILNAANSVLCLGAKFADQYPTLAKEILVNHPEPRPFSQLFDLGYQHRQSLRQRNAPPDQILRSYEIEFDARKKGGEETISDIPWPFVGAFGRFQSDTTGVADGPLQHGVVIIGLAGVFRDGLGIWLYGRPASSFPDFLKMASPLTNQSEESLAEMADMFLDMYQKHNGAI